MGPDALPALVLGLSPAGLAVVRSLGRLGVTVYGADPNPRSLGRYSRYCVHRPELGDAARRGEGDALVRGMLDLGRECGRPIILFAASDPFIELLAPAAERLAGAFRLTTDLARFGLPFLDKKRFYALCREHGVELPPTWFPPGLEELEERAPALEYPVVLKPARVHHFRSSLGIRKVQTASGPAELVAAYRELARVDPELIVQGVIPGADDRIWCVAAYLDRESRPLATLIVRKLRQYPPGFGSASLAETRRNAEVERLTGSFLGAVGYHGLCDVEYKLDPRDGRYKMFEINPRVPVWAGLGPAAGVDVAVAAYRDAADAVRGRSAGIAESSAGAPENPPRQADGVRWIYAARDVRSAARLGRAGELSAGAWWRSLRNCRADAVLAADDPGLLPRWALSKAARLPARAARIVRRLPRG
jgi:predicted ATP-grasp superfamily ATP-dependent carboligase